MKRSPLLRKAELKSRSGPRRKTHKDPVTEDLRNYILSRDKGCIGPRLEMDGRCSEWIEIDHILNGGTGKRGPSIPLNLVALCSEHHRLKTDNARTWRPLLIEYVARMEQRVDGSAWNWRHSVFCTNDPCICQDLVSSEDELARGWE